MADASSVNKKSRGRPSTGVGTLVGVRLQPELLSALDAYSTHADGTPSRPETVRRIVRDWLIANGYLRTGHREDAEALRPDQLNTENDG